MATFEYGPRSCMSLDALTGQTGSKRKSCSPKSLDSDEDENDSKGTSHKKQKIERKDTIEVSRSIYGSNCVLITKDGDVVVEVETIASKSPVLKHAIDLDVKDREKEKRQDFHVDLRETDCTQKDVELAFELLLTETPETEIMENWDMLPQIVRVANLAKGWELNDVVRRCGEDICSYVKVPLRLGACDRFFKVVDVLCHLKLPDMAVRLAKVHVEYESDMAALFRFIATDPALCKTFAEWPETVRGAISRKLRSESTYD